MATENSDLLQGTLNMLILKIVTLGPIHGYGISKRIQLISKEVLQVQQGSLYPALRRLEKRGWLKAKPGVSKSGRQIKFYSLSAKGRNQLAAEESNWNRLAKAVAVILKTAPSQGGHVGTTKKVPTEPITVADPWLTQQSLEPPARTEQVAMLNPITEADDVNVRDNEGELSQGEEPNRNPRTPEHPSD